VDGKVGAMVRVESSSVSFPGAFGIFARLEGKRSLCRMCRSIAWPPARPVSGGAVADGQYWPLRPFFHTRPCDAALRARGPPRIAVRCNLAPSDRVSSSDRRSYARLPTKSVICS
jgi:hypothetical protein